MLILLVLLAALLLIPFHLSAQIARREGRSITRFAVSGLYGIIGFSRTTEDGETTSALHLFRRTAWKRREEKKEEKDKEKKGIPTEDLLEALPELPDLIGAVLRLLNALRRSVAMERLKGEVRVGLGDPGQTGMLVGLTHAIGGMVSPWADVLDLTLLPVFDEAVLEGELEMRLRLRLLRLVVPAIRLFLKKTIRKMMKASGGGG
ncbi:MAG: DUF2953 domain-containing protein [Thermoplasmata archaeon]